MSGGCDVTGMPVDELLVELVLVGELVIAGVTLQVF